MIHFQMYGQLIIGKGSQSIGQERKVSSTNGVWKIARSHAKKLN